MVGTSLAIGCSSAQIPPPVEISPDESTPEPSPHVVETEPISHVEAQEPSPELDWEIGPIPILESQVVELRDRRPIPVPKPTPHRLSGALSTTAIREVIRGSVDQIRTCYETHPAEGGELRVALRFVIGATGRVTEVTLERRGTESGDITAEFEDCMREVISQLVFPPVPNGGFVVISYPFHFVSSS